MKGGGEPVCLLCVRRSAEQLVQNYLIETASMGLGRNLIAELLELGGIKVANPLVFPQGHNHSDVALVAADYNGFVLGRVQKGGQAPPCVRGGHIFHTAMIGEIDKGKASERPSPPVPGCRRHGFAVDRVVQMSAGIELYVYSGKLLALP
jgi:hypothetical protein